MVSLLRNSRCSKKDEMTYARHSLSSSPSLQSCLRLSSAVSPSTTSRRAEIVRTACLTSLTVSEKLIAAAASQSQRNPKKKKILVDMSAAMRQIAQNARDAREAEEQKGDPGMLDAA